MSAPDVCIVGAGPAGAWAAFHLARAGAQVRIFDSSHPREKPCGGGLTGRALALVGEALPRLAGEAVSVDRLRFGVDTPVGSQPVPHAEVPLVDRGLSSETTLVVASRKAFDGALLATALDAGARLVRARVVDISAGNAGVEVRTREGRYHAAWVLGADGANSLTRRRLASAFTRSQLSMATGYYAAPIHSREIVIECVGHPSGYIWSFPRPHHLAIGICTQADADTSADQLRRHIRDWCGASGLAEGACLTPYAWPIPSLAAVDFARERPVGPRWMLLGDAAGLVDPLTREGIYFALRSGILAARALLENDPTRYESDLRREIYPELARAADLKAGFFHPSFTTLLTGALQTRPAIRRVMVDLVGGRQPYRGLGRRLIATREAGLALRFVGHAARTRIWPTRGWW